MKSISPAPPQEQGLVSVVIVNYRGAQDTITCLQGLRDINWPADQLELIVVDNDSGDGSAELIRAAAPDVKVIESGANLGFAGGCNLGVAKASGEFVALINSDARPDAEWISEAVAAFRADRGVACVASKVLDWDGKLIDYVGGFVNFTGQGYKLEVGWPDSEDFSEPRDVLFATGSAAFFRVDSFRQVGGFDEQYFMFFEDVDLGWRMNLRGMRVRYVPTSLVYHRHHAAISKFGSYRERYLLERNGLLTIYKNLSDELLGKVLAPALLLGIRNAVVQGGANPFSLDLQRSPGGDEAPTEDVSRLTLSTVYGIDYLASNIAELTEQRERIQAERRIGDSALPGLFSGMLRSTNTQVDYQRTWDDTVDVFGLREALHGRRRIAVISTDTFASRMAGPAIRAFHIADQLAYEHDVKLVSTTKCTIDNDRFECLTVPFGQLEKVVKWAEVIIFQGFVMHHAPWIADTDKIIVVDIYDPMHLEQLEQFRTDDLTVRTQRIAATTDVLTKQLKRGDFFMCASEQQRHLWLGHLASVGRINPLNYEYDSSMRSLITICPFGLASSPATRTRAALRGVVPGIEQGDKVIIWAGGVYNWFDPLTLIRAVDVLRERHDNVRLFFLGMSHPNPDVPAMQMAYEAQQLSERLGLTGKYVFFNSEWVAYDDRQNYLLDADLGVSTHFEHVETTFSFRTRMLDYLWAGLPIVATGGDAFGELIQAQNLGLTVPEQDVEALVDALERSLYDHDFATECAQNVAALRTDFTWEKTLAPLMEFCRSAQRAPDAVLRRRGVTGSYALPGGAVRNLIGRNLAYARARVDEGGLMHAAKMGVLKARRLAIRAEPQS